MKKSFLLLVALFVFAGVSHAQDGMKAVKKAARALSSYNLDPAANADKLTKAKDLIMTAFETEEVKSVGKAYQVQGDVFAAVSKSAVNPAILDIAADVNMDEINLGVKAVSAYQKAYELAEKKFQKKDAIKGLKAMEGLLGNLAYVAYNKKNWSSAFDIFQTTISCSDFLKEIGEESTVTEESRTELMMNSLSVGSEEGSGIDIAPVVEKAIGMDIKEARLYQIAYNAFAETDKEKAVMYLDKGAELFPEDPGILFAQINYYIGEGQLEILIDKLKAAIKAEPDNATVYSTLGNVYDQLYTKESKEGSAEKAQEYFDGALEYYGKATEKDPKAFGAYYGIGALYFNKAATYGSKLNDLSSDFSAAGIKKYENLKKEMIGIYDASLPYLEKAEAINPKDGLVLQALKEYYARTGKLEKSAEYKAKIEALGAGN